MADIKIDVGNLNEQLKKLHEAIEAFRPYNKQFLTDTADKLDSANSDFIEKIRKTMKNMKDTDAPELLKDAENVYSSIQDIVKAFEEVDTKIAEEIKK